MFQLATSDQDAFQFCRRERLVVERDVFGPSCASGRGDTLGGGGAPDRHVRNSGEEEPVAFYHRDGKARAGRAARIAVESTLFGGRPAIGGGRNGSTAPGVGPPFPHRNTTQAGFTRSLARLGAQLTAYVSAWRQATGETPARSGIFGVRDLQVEWKEGDQ